MSEPRNQFCATCGKRRGGLEQRRESWSICATPIVPRCESVEGRPWQQTNDLIISAQVYRNGGTSEDCHLCNECLIVGLRVLKSGIEQALGDAGPEREANALIASLTQQVGQLQHGVKELEYLREAGVPAHAWNHTDFLQAVAGLWKEHTARLRDERTRTP